MLGKSPQDDVIMRQRQSSEMIATQYPVMSIGAPARAVGGAWPPRPWAVSVLDASIRRIRAIGARLMVTIGPRAGS